MSPVQPQSAPEPSPRSKVAPSAAGGTGRSGVPSAAPSRASSDVSRRAFLKGAGGVASAGMLNDLASAQDQPSAPQPLRGKVEIELSINGRAQRVSVEPRTTLLDCLRVHLNPPLTGTKLVCGMGNCGACTVLLDGQAIYSCLRLAVECVGRRITTIEGLSDGDTLSPVQAAFVDCDALMCGFCTPGLVMSVTACLEKSPSASLDEIRRATSGNLCRCGTYPFVFDAALEAGRRIQARRQPTEAPTGGDRGPTEQEAPRAPTKENAPGTRRNV